MTAHDDDAHEHPSPEDPAEALARRDGQPRQP
jgi:hypothetical protein